MVTKRKAPSVSLQVVFPGSRTISIEAEANEQMKTVKEMVAKAADLSADNFSLTFEGEEVGSEDDTRLVSDLPFEDQSVLQVVVSEKYKKQEALKKLSVLGWEGSTPEDVKAKMERVKYLRVRHRAPAICEDKKYWYVFAAMVDAGLCEDKDTLGDLLVYFAENNFVRCIELFITRTNVDATGRFGLNALQTASRYGFADAVSLLLAAHADVLVTTRENMTLLHLATGEAVVRLLLTTPIDVNAKDASGRTRLCLASLNGEIGVITLLLESSADVNKKDSSGNSPLHLAQNGDVVACLLQAKAIDVNARNVFSRTPLHFTVNAKCVNACSCLLASSGDVHVKDKYGNTPLHYAAARSLSSISSLLLTWSANVNAKDNKGGTPLHLARNKNMAALLLRHGADVDVRNCNGETPLHVASLHCRADVVLALLAASADVNTLDHDGKTALFLAPKRHIAAQLLLHKADVNTKARNGVTPLHQAVCHGDHSIVSLLLASGADVSTEDAHGNTALHLARGEKIVSALKKSSQSSRML